MIQPNTIKIGFAIFKLISFCLTVTGIFFGGYNFYRDTNSFDRLVKARESLDNGREMLQKIKSDKNLDRDIAMEQSYAFFRRGVEMLNDLKDQKTFPKCPDYMRKEAINELINFYNLYINPENSKYELDKLKIELNNY